MCGCGVMLVALCCALLAFSEQVSAGTEGSVCARGKQNGTCVPARRCESMILDLREGTPPPICELGERGEPVVCCTDCELVDNIDNYYLTQRYGRIVKTGRKSWDACIDAIVDPKFPCQEGLFFSYARHWQQDKKCNKIGISVVSPAGGKDAVRAEFPFMALLGYGEELDSAQWLCGGSILSTRFILTAAHCISSPRVGSVRFAALGILKRTDPPEYWQRHNVEDIIPHPDYASPSKYHDIALLKTKDTITYTVNVHPACLFSGGLSGYTNTTHVLGLGWGYLGPKTNLADNLQKVELKEFSAEECATLYPENRHMLKGFDNVTQMCYGDRDQLRDTCQGDSGGPLVMHGRELRCQASVLGVTSSGEECGFVAAGLYTRVLHYTPWIESVVWP